jgi:hypothetical protein
MEAHSKSSMERRKHKRFKSQGETYAVFRASSPILGRIIDISEGGLSIFYIEGDEKPAEVVALDLFTLNNDVKVSSIAAVARSDQELFDQNDGKPETAHRRGIEFIGLLDGQKEAVRELILKQTAGNGD